MNYNYLYLYSLIFDFKTSDNGESERKETLIGKVQKFCFPPLPTGFSNIGIKEPPYEERKRYYRNSSSVSQVSAVQAQTSASCYRTPSDCSDRILRHCGRFKNSSNRVPVHKTVMGTKIPCHRIAHGKTIEWQGKIQLEYTSLISLSFHYIPFYLTRAKTKALQMYNDFPNPARNVNSVLTFERGYNFRKIAATENKQVYNSLKIRTLKRISRWNICLRNVLPVLNTKPP